MTLSLDMLEPKLADVPDLGLGRGPLTITVTAVRRSTYSAVYSCRVSPCEGGPSMDIVAKIFTEAGGGLLRAQRQYATLTRLWPTFAESTTYRLPRPLSLIVDPPTVVMERAEGRSLQSLLTAWTTMLGLRHDVLVAGRRAGGWLRFMHTATRVNPTKFDAAAKLESARVHLDRLAAAGLSHRVAQQALGTLERWAATLHGRPMPSAMVHGDFSIDNVLFDGTRVVAIDVEGRDFNAVEHDVASFLNSVALVALMQPVSGSLLERFETAFLDGYGHHTSVDERALRFLRVCGSTSSALEIVTRRASQRLACRWVSAHTARILGRLTRDDDV